MTTKNKTKKRVRGYLSLMTQDGVPMIAFNDGVTTTVTATSQWALDRYVDRYGLSIEERNVIKEETNSNKRKK